MSHARQRRGQKEEETESDLASGALKGARGGTVARGFQKIAGKARCRLSKTIKAEDACQR
jgi:hypothetical protein